MSSFRKRDIVLAAVIGTLATLAAVGILSDGFGGPGSSFKHPEALSAPAHGGEAERPATRAQFIEP